MPQTGWMRSLPRHRFSMGLVSKTLHLLVAGLLANWPLSPSGLPDGLPQPRFESPFFLNQQCQRRFRGPRMSLWLADRQ